ncbi:MAG: hypothetical protein JWM77_4080 [Rhodospirillales bacterium]|jgi:DUF917 family protein|nr:hypothetical protein [Rhodospirillales bacterium]
MMFTRDLIEDLARGAAFLGTGGGGDPYIGSMLLRQAMRDVDGIRIISVDEVPPDALVVPSAMMGAPTVLIEKLPNGAEALQSLTEIEEAFGQKAFAVMPAEIGGLNALLPLVLAAKTGLPVVDADGMGRAFPELQMTTFHVHGQPASPISITDEHGNCVVIWSKNDLMGEKLARATVVAMGATCQMCCFAMLGKHLAECGVRGTLTAAIEIGRAIRLARAAHRDPFEALLATLAETDYYKSSYVLFDGKVSDLHRETTGGFARGSVRIDAIAPFTGVMEVSFQNEHLVAKHDGVVRAIVPDLIAILDRETAEPITTEGLRYGQRVKVMAASAAPVMRSPAALDVFGPQMFGLDAPFTPVEQLNAAR